MIFRNGYDFLRNHRQINDVLNRVSAADDDFRRLHTSEDEIPRAFPHVNPNKQMVPITSHHEY